MKIFFSLSMIMILFLAVKEVEAQPHLVPEDKVTFYTSEWDGERDKYGRPIVSDNVIERMEHVAVEEAWSTLKDAGYNNQLEVNWEILDRDQVMVGRAFTTAFLPKRPGLDERMIEMGREEGLGGGTNQWPMEMLVEGDVIVADHYNKLEAGAFIGNNLAQAIHSNSGNGPIIYGHGRDIIGVRNIEGFNAWTKAWHPSHSAERMLISINDITRIGEAVVSPGDVVLASESGVIFIPAHLAERVLVSSEVSRLEDKFRMEAMSEGKYSSQEVYSTEWSDSIEEEFYNWQENNRSRLHEELGIGYEVLDKISETKSLNWEEWLEE